MWGPLVWAEFSIVATASGSGRCDGILEQVLMRARRVRACVLHPALAAAPREGLATLCGRARLPAAPEATHSFTIIFEVAATRLRRVRERSLAQSRGPLPAIPKSLRSGALARDAVAQLACSDTYRTAIHRRRYRRTRRWGGGRLWRRGSCRTRPVRFPLSCSPFSLRGDGVPDDRPKSDGENCCLHIHNRLEPTGVPAFGKSGAFRRFSRRRSRRRRRGRTTPSLSRRDTRPYEAEILASTRSGPQCRRGKGRGTVQRDVGS